MATKTVEYAAGQMTITTSSSDFETLSSVTLPSNTAGLQINNLSGGSYFYQVDATAATTSDFEIADQQPKTFEGNQIYIERLTFIGAANRTVSYTVFVEL